MNQAHSPATAARPKSKMKWIIIGGTLLLVVLIGAGVAANRNKDRGIAVTTEKATVRTITQVVTATGKIRPEVEVKISPEVAGEIVELPVKEGQTVQRGDLLVRIKPDFYQAQLEQQEAALSSTKAASVLSQARLTKAEEDYRQSQDLYAKKLISDADYLSVKTNVEVARADFASSLAQIRRAEGSLSQAADQLSKTAIYAPMDGTVSSLSSEAGERVVGTGQFAGTEIMRVANLDSMEVRVKVNENDIVNVKVGDVARITIDAFPGRTFKGEVKEIASAALTVGQNTLEEVTNFEVRVRITDKDVRLRPGMSANTDIETRTAENVVAVPIQAVTVRSREGAKTIDQLTEEREKKARETKGEGAAAAVNERQQRERERADREALQRVVFVRDGDKVKQVVVETGIADSSHMEIKSGLNEGDEVVSGSFTVITRTLKDGSAIRIERPRTDKAKK
jgi:HlyD family secretion protein